jgi:anti-sigma factor RsiW
MMKITDDVVRDLIVLVDAGEASADTRALVESYLAEHPAIAEEGERQRRRHEAWALPPSTRPAGASAETERAALRRTKRLLGYRGWAMAAAIFFTALPLSFAVIDGEFQWIFWPGHAGLATGSLLLGVVAWVAHAIVARKLRPKGF